MQADIAEAQERLGEIRVTGSAGGGLVDAVVSGNGELIGLTIDPSVVDPADVETLADLVVAAVRDANRQAADLRDAAMNPVAGGLADSFSGLGLPGLLGFPGGGAVLDADEPDRRRGRGR